MDEWIDRQTDIGRQVMELQAQNKGSVMLSQMFNMLQTREIIMAVL